MSRIDDWYYQKSWSEHFAHMFFAPATIVNPFFYEGLYESTQDDTTAHYVAEHLFYLSPWLPAAVYAGQTPFHVWSSGLTIMRYVAADAGLFSLPTAVLVGSAAATAGWIATAEHHGAVTPGVASGFGMPITPELYSRGTSSDPLGIRRDLRDMFGLN